MTNLELGEHVLNTCKENQIPLPDAIYCLLQCVISLSIASGIPQETVEMVFDGMYKVVQEKLQKGN